MLDSVKGFFFFESNRSKLLLFAAVATSTILYLGLFIQHSMAAAYFDSGMRSIFDCFIFFFKGIPERSESPDARFDIPVLWLSQNIAIGALVACYCSKNTRDRDRQVLIRCCSRFCWWFGQCGITVSLIVIFYGTCFLVGLLASCCFGDSQLGVSDSFFSRTFLGSNRFELIGTREVFFNMMVPLALATTVSLAQVVITQIAGPSCGFASVIGYLLLSSYFDEALFFGDCSMLLRSSLADPSYTSGGILLIALAFVGLIFFFVGYAIILKKNF